jgi:hypothetical protein
MDSKSFLLDIPTAGTIGHRFLASETSPDKRCTTRPETSRAMPQHTQTHPKPTAKASREQQFPEKNSFIEIDKKKPG